jgi:hypothetical protein
VLVYAYGGWDVTYAFDPKLDTEGVEGPEVDSDLSNPLDREFVRDFGGLPVVTNLWRRPSSWRFFERWADRVAIVNGIKVGSIGHALARQRILTGVSSTLPGADLATIAGAVHGSNLPVGCMDLYGTASPGPLASSLARVGQRSQLAALLQLDTPMTGAGRQYPLYAPEASDLSALASFRQERMRGLEERWLGTRARSRLADMSDSMARAQRLRERSGVLNDALQVLSVPDFELQCSLAADVLSEGLSHSVFIDTTQDWDTHADTVTQHTLFDGLFRGLDVLADRLESDGLIDDVLVVVVSEMTRTPRRNATGGKDHWPFSSAMLFGAGTVGGRVYGGTDAQLQSLPVNLDTGLLDPAGELATFENFGAGILEKLQVDPEDWMPGIKPWRGAWR